MKANKKVLKFLLHLVEIPMNAFPVASITCRHQDLLKLRFVISSAAITVTICKEGDAVCSDKQNDPQPWSGSGNLQLPFKYQNNQQDLNTSLTVMKQSARRVCRNTENKSSLSMLRQREKMKLKHCG